MTEEDSEGSEGKSRRPTTSGVMLDVQSFEMKLMTGSMPKKKKGQSLKSRERRKDDATRGAHLQPLLRQPPERLLLLNGVPNDGLDELGVLRVDVKEGSRMTDLREKSDEELTSFLKMGGRPDRRSLVLEGVLERSNEDGREKCTENQARKREDQVSHGETKRRDGEKERDETRR